VLRIPAGGQPEYGTGRQLFDLTPGLRVNRSSLENVEQHFLVMMSVISAPLAGSCDRLPKSHERTPTIQLRGREQDASRNVANVDLSCDQPKSTRPFRWGLQTGGETAHNS
jgi:hypothetical protein